MYKEQEVRPDGSGVQQVARNETAEPKGVPPIAIQLENYTFLLNELDNAIEKLCVAVSPVLSNDTTDQAPQQTYSNGNSALATNMSVNNELLSRMLIWLREITNRIEL